MGDALPSRWDYAGIPRLFGISKGAYMVSRLEQCDVSLDSRRSITAHDGVPCSALFTGNDDDELEADLSSSRPRGSFETFPCVSNSDPWLHLLRVRRHA